jgi:hypothetical protein
MEFDFDPLRQGILLVLTLLQVLVNWLAGNKNNAAWLLGVAGFAPWVAYIVGFGEWGMAPFVVLIQLTYIRNLWKTRREHRRDLPPVGATPARSRPA